MLKIKLIVLYYIGVLFKLCVSARPFSRDYIKSVSVTYNIPLRKYDILTGHIVRSLIIIRYIIFVLMKMRGVIALFVKWSTTYFSTPQRRIVKTIFFSPYPER